MPFGVGYPTSPGPWSEATPVVEQDTASKIASIGKSVIGLFDDAYSVYQKSRYSPKYYKPISATSPPFYFQDPYFTETGLHSGGLTIGGNGPLILLGIAAVVGFLILRRR